MNASLKSEQKTTQEQLSVVRNKIYEFIDKYHSDNPNGDTVFSAYSIFLAFAVLYPGADGETKNQLEKVFGFNEIDNFANCISYLVSNGNEENPDVKYHKDRVCKYIKILENTLWIDKKFTITKGYEEITNKMQSTLNTANFSKQSEEERVRINKHVEEITQNLIKGIIPQGSIKNDTPMVITNAVFFHSQWIDEFWLMKKGINFKDVGEVKSMKRNDYFQSTITDKLTIVSIPYRHCKNFMTLIMPQDMKSFEQSFNLTQINELVTNNLKQKQFLLTFICLF